MPWAEIGGWLGLGPAAAEDGVTVAEAAFSFATGPPIPGPGAGHPEDMEHGVMAAPSSPPRWRAGDAEWTQEA
jgi:hypothetical protein